MAVFGLSGIILEGVLLVRLCEFITNKISRKEIITKHFWPFLSKLLLILSGRFSV